MNLLHPLLIAATGAGSVFCIILSLLPTRNPLATRIERMQQITLRAGEDRFERIEEIAAAEPIDRLRARLIEAGWYKVTPAQFALRSLGGLAAGVCAGLLLYDILPVKLPALILGPLIALLGWRAPKIALDRAIRARKSEVERAVPDFLDMLASTVRAGLALSSALLQAVDVTFGALEDELRSALAEIGLGRERSAALLSMAERINEPQLSSAVTAIVQAEKLGANVSAVLHELAVDSRHYRWALAEERAARLPIQMLIPMALLMIPSLYVMIFGPIIANILMKR